jgi:hypothetical protein
MQFSCNWQKCPFLIAANVTVQMQLKQVTNPVYDVLEMVLSENYMYFSN